VSRLASELASTSGHSVEYETLNHTDAADAICEFAEGLRAALIVCATHGRTGLARMVVGSTAAEIIRHAPCPVLVSRSPHLS
jgi:universal stress protein A